MCVNLMLGHTHVFLSKESLVNSKHTFNLCTVMLTGPSIQGPRWMGLSLFPHICLLLFLLLFSKEHIRLSSLVKYPFVGS